MSLKHAGQRLFSACFFLHAVSVSSSIFVHKEYLDTPHAFREGIFVIIETGSLNNLIPVGESFVISLNCETGLLLARKLEDLQRNRNQFFITNKPNEANNTITRAAIQKRLYEIASLKKAAGYPTRLKYLKQFR
jgi:hypothetical protein